jgi:hypothetical protein
MRIIAHTIIFAACLVGALEVSRSFVALIHLRWRTRISAKVFFVTCGLTHLGLALNESGTLFFALTDYLQALGLVAFLALLVQDLFTALRRLQAAFRAIHSEHGKDGDRMIATITLALQQGGRRLVRDNQDGIRTK